MITGLQLRSRSVFILAPVLAGAGIDGRCA